MGKIRYTKELLEPIVIKSNSINGVLRELNLIPGANNERIWRYIKLFNINVNHFNRKIPNRGNYGKHLNELLIENSTASRGSIKYRLYKEGLKQHQCELCGQGEEWRGKKMSLILDHINGINNDHRIENLRIVCPNCNATLNTHCKGNKIIKEKIDNPNKGKHKENSIKRLKLLETLELIKKSNVDFTKKTWGSKLSKITGLTSQRCLKIVKEFIPELLNNSVVQMVKDTNLQN